MEATTMHDAEKIFLKEWGDYEIRLHSALVLDECLRMSDGADEEAYTIAAWLHDLGRKDDKETHHLLGLQYAEQYFKKHPEQAHLKTVVIDCISNHRSNGTPTTPQGIIFQKADKTSLKRLEWKRRVKERRVMK
jgi:HD superfamily phosphodiesterase